MRNKEPYIFYQKLRFNIETLSNLRLIFDKIFACFYCISTSLRSHGSDEGDTSTENGRTEYNVKRFNIPGDRVVQVSYVTVNFLTIDKGRESQKGR